MIDKRVRSLAEAVAGIPDGATILCAGFGGAGLPDALCEAVIEQGVGDLTIVANNAGTGRTGLAALLAAGRVRRIICSFPRSSGSVVFEELYAAGRIELELVPQGIISERMRCAAAGLGGFYSPVSVGTRKTPVPNVEAPTAVFDAAQLPIGYMAALPSRNAC